MPSQADAPLEPLVRKLGYRAELDNEDRQAILSLPYTAKSIPRLGHIVSEREKVTGSCVLLSGFAIRHKVIADGARQIMAINMAGDLVDLQNSFLGIADHNVQVITDCEVALIPAAELKRLAIDRPQVGMALWLDTLVDASVFREWIVNVGRRSAQTRLAHLLCEIAFRQKVAGLGGPSDYVLPLTQEQIADCTGLTSVHVNRTLKMLEAERLIERRSKRMMTIGNWKKLATKGDFDTAYLHVRSSDAENGLRQN